jgi:hypothetical protein
LPAPRPAGPRRRTEILEIEQARADVAIWKSAAFGWSPPITLGDQLVDVVEDLGTSASASWTRASASTLFARWRAAER